MIKVVREDDACDAQSGQRYVLDPYVSTLNLQISGPRFEKGEALKFMQLEILPIALETVLLHQSFIEQHHTQRLGTIQGPQLTSVESQADTILEHQFEQQHPRAISRREEIGFKSLEAGAVVRCYRNVTFFWYSWIGYGRW